MKRIVSLLLCLLMLLTILPAYASADNAGEAAFWKQYFENFMTYVLFEKLGLEPDETHCREVDRDSLLRTFLRSTGSCDHKYEAPFWDWDSEEDLVYATFTCEKCGESVVLNTTPVFIETIPASGSEPAKKKYEATIEFMGETYVSVHFKIVESHNHIYGEPEWGVDSNPNLIAIFTCSECARQETVNATVNKETKIPATCTTPKMIVYQGSVKFQGKTYVNNEYVYVVSPALGHIGAWTSTDPTCTEPGEKTRTCSRCSETETIVVAAALGHDFSDWTQTAAPTCTESGEESRSCSRCGEIETRGITALGHDYQVSVTPPSCTEGGFTKYTCSRCGDSYIDNETEPDGHTWTGPIWNWDSQEDLVFALFLCDVCGDFAFQMAPPVNESKEPSCTEDGYERISATVEFEGVRYTDYKYLTVLDALGHDYGSKITKPTCTEKGYTAHTCSRCGDQYTTDEVAALGHDWDAGKVTQQPTASEEGVRTYTCKRCGETITESIPRQNSFEFDDVKNKNAYYYDAVYWAYSHKPYQVTAGIDKTHFGPDRTVTRAQAMVFFWAAKDRPKFKQASTQFVDVKKGDWYYKAVMWAVEKGITAGTDATHFSPNKTCNRAEILTFLYAAMNKPKVKISNPYKDVTNQWYKKAALWAYENRIERGENGKFNAATACTRASTVTYLYRFLERKGLVE